MGGAMAKVSIRIEYLGKDTALSAANINDPQSFSLSDSEAQILLLLQAGKENAEVAAEVGTDQAVVKEHIKSILRKAIGYRDEASGGIRTSQFRASATRQTLSTWWRKLNRTGERLLFSHFMPSARRTAAPLYPLMDVATA
jgi:DNA-binding CsgD family transcriptional regulator